MSIHTIAKHAIGSWCLPLKIETLTDFELITLRGYAIALIDMHNGTIN